MTTNTTNNKPISTSNSNKDKLKPKTHSQDFIPSFIRKTYDILEEAKFPQLIDWSPEGNAIVIKKPSEFSQKVLPVYFKHNNLTSFVRQLNMYNFHKRRSQNLEHVYSHELFQKGKRNLLKEIKRKTHDHTTDKVQKSPDSQETPKSEDISSLVNENQFLKRLYNEAMSRISMLENQAKELANQNQSLWTQISYNRPQMDQNKQFRPLVASFEPPKELTQDQLSMTMGKVTLNISSGCKGPAQMNKLFQNPVSAVPANNGMMQFSKPFFSNIQQQQQQVVQQKGAMTEESSGSTEVSPTSPVMHPNAHAEGNMERTTPFMMVNQSLQIPKLRMEPNMQAFHIPHHIAAQQQAMRMNSDLGISRQEMSVGQLFDAWSSEFQQGEELLCFADQQQKGDNNKMAMIQAANLPQTNNANAIAIANATAAAAAAAGNIQAVFQDKSLLGKRKFDMESNCNVPDPTMKRHELSIFSRKGMISTGIEDKEIVEGAGTSAADDIDLMNFNQPFCGWPKAS